jgi:predicted nucleic acid-binding protein
MLLLDTNVVSELRKAPSGKANARVITWAKRQDESTLFVSAITLMELELGALQMERRDPRQGAVLRRWLNEYVEPAFLNRILPVDDEVAKRCASLHVPNPCSYRDSLIGATALVHGMTIATRNTRDFAKMGPALLNPWGS